MTTATSNQSLTEGYTAEATQYIERLENLIQERKDLAADFKDVLEEAAGKLGLSKAAIKNVLKERTRDRVEVHITYRDMDKLRAALKMPDPLLADDDDDDGALSPQARPHPNTDEDMEPIGQTSDELLCKIGRGGRA